MKRFLIALLAALVALPAFAQSPPFPASMPPKTVVGNMAPFAAPGTAVSLSVLQAQMGNLPGNVQTVSYTIASTDCGKVVQMGTGSTGSLTVSLPAAAGFVEGCKVTVKNGDTTRGKTLSGFPSDFSPTNILWPSQAGQIQVVGGAWVTTVAPGPWFAPGNVTLNVDHIGGSTSGVDCLVSSGAGACKTIFQAFLLFQQTIRVGPGNGAIATIQSDCGFTETPSGAFLGPILSTNGVLFVVGNQGSPTSCTWTTGGIHVDDGMVMSLRGFQIVGTGGVNCVSIEKLGLLVSANMAWGTCAGGAHIALFQGGQYVNDGGTETVVGSANFHIFNDSGNVNVNLAGITIPNALAFSAWYESSSPAARADFTSSTYTGAGVAATTGQPYILNGGSINLFGVTLPGTSTASRSSGTCLDNNCNPCPPNRQVFTSGTNATYTTPACNGMQALYIEIDLAGGGGGGGGSGTTPGSATAGNPTCWNTSGTACSSPVYQGGGGGAGGTTGGAQGLGGTISGSGTCDEAIPGGAGVAATGSGTNTALGGAGPLGGAGTSAVGTAGTAGATNTGAGGGGGGLGGAGISAGGGGGGATCRVTINTPANTYVYTVGATAGGGSAGTSGLAGGAGAAGRIKVIARWH